MGKGFLDLLTRAPNLRFDSIIGLLASIQNDDAAMVDAIIKTGCAFDAFKVATHSSNPEYISTLVDRCGFDPLGTDVDGVPFLHRLAASRLPFLDQVCTFVMEKFGADPNARDAFGKTALHWLAEDFPLWRTIRAFYIHGADPRARDAVGRTPYDYWHPRCSGEKSSDPYTASWWFRLPSRDESPEIYSLVLHHSANW